MLDSRSGSHDAAQGFNIGRHAARKPPMRQEAAVERTSRRRKRVLIAEDSDDLRHVLSKVIDAEPDLQCVGTVAVPEQLPTAVAQLQPDVLVLDLVLEGGTSMHMIQKLRASNPELRIVLYSGYVGSVVLGEARRRGAAACVAKGDDYENLMDAIRGFLPPGVESLEAMAH
jgi:DNA-binding NarL/FixJ family response regulator